jgi:hypothetical protein
MIGLTFPNRHPALRALRSIPARHPCGERCACHARIARLRARSLVAELCSASGLFPPLPLRLG